MPPGGGRGLRRGSGLPAKPPSAALPPPPQPSPGPAGGGGSGRSSAAGARLVGRQPLVAAEGGGGGIMAARSPRPQQLLRCSVKVLLAREELPAGLQLASPSQKPLQLELQPGEEDADVTVTDADGVCVFKCLVNRDTEYCHVGKQSVLITLGYNSALLQFKSQAEYYTFSNALKGCRSQKKENSVFSQRTDEASAAQYFQVVLDVGCGSGILSFFAVQAGARKVYAVEASSMAKYAELLVRSNNLSDKITVLSGKIEEISLPESVDVVISEPMGYMLFNERMLESYLHAKKWLKSNGMMFPTYSDIHLAPFSDEQLYMEHYSRANFWYQECFYGVNLSSLRSAAVDEYFRQPIVDTFDVRILMARTVKYTVNFMEAAEEDLHRVEIPFVFQMMQSGLIHGLAFWFDVAFVGSLVTVWLSTAPTEPLTHWYQVRCLLQTPLFAKEGETLSGKVLFVANKRQSYDIQIVAMVDQTGFKSGNILDLKNPFFRYA
ncbi:histone-arginine methyltransferase CARM1-like isoform X2 [Rissa tridactyla]|uniref:histone-arginine methyltransferase CARM1-like isoform X2 n=1 Tax=Rissa tridactyla TaxID=75485 RepID=UPI0023BB1087|nr:histone-arginine methyltransferase CARM1-like isoform X2 [Rissa tridactyla]